MTASETDQAYQALDTYRPLDFFAALGEVGCSIDGCITVELSDDMLVGGKFRLRKPDLLIYLQDSIQQALP